MVAVFIDINNAGFTCRFQPARATTNKGDAVPGRPCPPALLEDEAHALKDMKRCIEEFHDDKRCSPSFTVLQDGLTELTSHLGLTDWADNISCLVHACMSATALLT